MYCEIRQNNELLLLIRDRLEDVVYDIGQEGFLILNSRINRDIHPDTSNAVCDQAALHVVCGESFYKSK